MRHLDDAPVLRRNALARNLLVRRGVEPASCSDAAIAEIVRSEVERAVAGLPELQQAVVRRCDLGGERFADAARALYVSERTAYRERDAALPAVLSALVSPPLERAPRPVADVADVALVQARSLEQNGQWRAAAALLEGLAREADGPRRFRIEVRLVRLHATFGDRFDVERCVAAARALATGAEGEAHVACAEARVAESRGEGVLAARLAAKACAVLPGRRDRRLGAEDATLLVDARTLLATTAVGSGDLCAAARSIATALDDLTRGAPVDLHTELVARSIAAMTALFGAGDPVFIESELGRCLRAAAAAGLTHTSLEIASHLSAFYRLERRPRESVALLAPLVSVADLVGCRLCTSAVYHEVAAASLEVGDVASAAAHARPLLAAAAGQPLLEPMADFFLARLSLATSAFGEALEFARRAETGYARADQDRMAATALRVQAESLARLGDLRAAVACARRSVDGLDGRTHPARVAAAYRLLGALSCDTRLTERARLLLRRADGV